LMKIARDELRLTGLHHALSAANLARIQAKF
jgi:hypothetical protein